ncbi:MULTISPECIES: rRNA maturation RNase YbeY [Flavobacteriaceae]|uniref:rRNA maturation RNase YbeY n=1 Tax=Flavobacteriaceae TaxID=49546 RepID=UPI001490DF28|nr:MULTISPECIES: rRNA maturation RNase YbeY [Allomuricauda]MDC6365165.1 rRNA maturation RNase YbeY [Muricauda sp. AC10]
MIDFHFESNFVLEDKTNYSDWITGILNSEGFLEGQIDYIFCSDEYLLKLNMEYLNHDTFTDIITFDYTNGETVSGDIFISIDRVMDNAESFGVTFENELLRVMAHGVLHLMSYGDKSEDEKVLMRSKEEEKIKMFHVEQ